jgi:hypothetical protein
MKSTPLTQGASTLILAVYLLHTFMTAPFVHVLISIAAGVIAFGFLDSYELAVAFAVVAGVMFGLVSQTKFSYETKFTKEGFNVTDTPQQIIHRIEEIKKEIGPRGVLASSYAEGFADATTDNSGNEVTATSTSTTTSAETKAAPANTNGNAGSGIPPESPPPAATTVTQQAATGGQVAGFTGSSKKDMEFKLGVIPEDTKGGYHIDQGTTVINALNALKPDQIQAMTEDTRKLIETQKNLMSMLGTMKPMLQDGKQMMANFQEMFGNGSMKV